MKSVVFAVLAALSTDACFASDRWITVQSEHFELYTSGNQDAGRKAVVFFERVHDLFAGWNAKDNAPAKRVRIIVFQSEKEYQQYQPNHLAEAFFQAGKGGEFIVMKNLSPESYPVAVHEYVHLVVRHSGLKLTTAMNEGLAEFYSTLKITPQGIEIGNPPETRLMSLRRGGFIPLSELLTIGTGSSVYQNAGQLEVFYAESWALTHMLLLSPEYRSKTTSYAHALQGARDPLAVLERTTGKTVGQIESDLQKYERNTRFVTAQLDGRAGQHADHLPEARPATRQESGMALADLLDSMGRHAEASERYQELALPDSDPRN